jgi:hypothetical protein
MELAPEADVDGDAEAMAADLLFAEGTIPGIAAGEEAGEADGDHEEDHATATRQLSASELAYDADAEDKAEASTARHRFHFSGEPLPALKLIVQGKLGSPKANLRAFIDMWSQATVRRGTHGARTFISPADGLASIITGVILLIVEKYRDIATPAQKRTLDTVLAHHLRLLSTPLSANGRSGGHRVGGVKHQGKGIAGPALNHGNSVRLETVNQTAVVLLGLERLAMNDELRHVHQARIDRLIAALTPEFKACLLKCYRGRDVHDWHYGLSTRLEDQSHLKTTWDMLKKLARTQSRAKEWYEAQADRIAHLWPRVTGSWDGLSNAAGTLPHTH